MVVPDLDKRFQMRRAVHILSVSLFFAAMLLLLSGCAKKLSSTENSALAHEIAEGIALQNKDFEEGKTRFKSGDYSAALPYFQRAVSSAPTYGLFHNWLGMTYFHLKRFDEAITHIEISNRSQESAWNYYFIGQCYFQKGAYETALIPFQKFAAMEPNHYAGYHWLGSTYNRLHRYQEAIAQFEHSNRIKVDAGNYAGLGVAKFMQGDYTSALSDFIQWSSFEPANPDPYLWKGQAYYRMQRYHEAIDQFQRSNGLKEAAANYRGTGDSYVALGDYAKALDAYTKALGLSDTETEKEKLQLSIASCHLAMGNDDDAHAIIGKRPYLGLNLMDKEQKIVVVGVVKRSPADLAGMKTGDILTSFRGRSLNGIGTEKFILDILSGSTYGTVANIGIERDGNVLETPVTVGILSHGTGPEPVQQAAALPLQRGMHWAVIIGVSDYEDSRIPTLRYAASDAKAFYDWAVSPEGGRYAPSNVTLLLNEQATASKMRMALFQWLRSAIEEDVVTIYFAGHGSPETPGSDNLFLLPYDVRYDSIASTGFPMWDIETALKRFIRAKKVVVIADACHSGGVGKPFDVARRGDRGLKLNPISSTLQSLSHVGNGICIITASDDGQFSQEGQQWGGGRGVFTHYLLLGLEGDADYNRDRAVSLGELIPYLSEQVRRATQNEQSPTVSGKFDPAMRVGK